MYARILLCVSAVLALAGCGSDTEKKAESTEAPPPSVSQATTAPRIDATTTTAPQPKTTTLRTSPPTTSEPDAGDEQPISTPVMLTGRGGRIRPKLVQVPAFIAVRITLRSSDQLTYQLDIGGKTTGVDVEKRENSLMLGGLRSGKRYVGTGPNGRVVISATGEPGP